MLWLLKCSEKWKQTLQFDEKIRKIQLFEFDNFFVKILWCPNEIETNFAIWWAKIILKVNETFLDGFQIQWHRRQISYAKSDAYDIIFYRHFADATEFMDDAIQKEGKVFINCVFGKSRSTTFVVVYLMLCHNWDALTALKHIRQKRPVQINAGFLLQLVDLDYKLKWEKLIKWSLWRIKLCMYFGQHN